MQKDKYLKVIEEVIEKGPFDADWDSLREHDTPKWYQKDKFGIFIHWGIYAVPAFGNEWYARYVYRQGSPENKYHVEKYGPLNEFGYKDFIPMFKAEKFDANEWADLFKAAGAKFVMPVAEHHDGFQMYESDLSKWNSKEMGPMRDILGELKGAVEEKDMKICASSHRAEHWWFMSCGKEFDSDVCNPAYEDFYGPAVGPMYENNEIYGNSPDKAHLEDWLVRTCEIVDKYQPKIMFFDWWIQNIAFKPYLKKFAAYYYNRAAEWGIEVAINAKFDAFAHGTVVKDIERGQLSAISHEFWQNDTSVAKNSWGYTEGNDYKTTRSIVCDLIDVVSKNGALLLNIGPKADGTIPEEDKQILLGVGDWLKVNGEAIYDTIPWKIYGEGPTEVPEGHFTDTNRSDFTDKDVRYTSRANVVYAHIMKWPEDGQITLREVGAISGKLKSSITKISILGYDEEPLFETRSALEISAKCKVTSDLPVVIKIEVL